MWLVLICCERKILLAGWWLMLVWCERKILLAGCSRTEFHVPLPINLIEYLTQNLGCV